MDVFKEKDRLPGPKEIIENRYLINRILGDGGYGTVLEATDVETNRRLAIKTEKYSKSMIHVEVQVLRAAKNNGCKHFPHIFDQGTVNKEYVFVVMSLLGKDLYRLKNEQRSRRFSPATAIRVGIQTLEALFELHSIGFISRDVKPGNFVVGLKEKRNLYIIDFGLARKYIDGSGKHRSSRGEIGWRGTARYGSLQAHFKKDLSRKDDIESWLYMNVEFWKGCLPWRHLIDRTEIQAIKTDIRSKRKTEFFTGCPEQFKTLLEAIDSWDFKDIPTYDVFFKVLHEIADDHQVTSETPYDWG